MHHPTSVTAPHQQRPWWESKPFLFAVVLSTMVPLLYPPIPPLVDLFGHLGRYRVQLDIDTSPWLQQYYGFSWQAIGNLGVDLLIIPLSKLFGLELAVKLIVLAIPPLTAAGFLWVAREVHHRLPPTVFFALPFVYNHPFLFGFANYALSMAFAFLAFGLWLRLARLGKTRLRAILFVPISILVFFTHTYGWGALGLLCFSAEAVRQHDNGIRWFKAGLIAALHTSVMALPLAIIIGWRSDAHVGMTRFWFEWKMKWEWVHSSLRDRWKLFDWASLALVALLLLFAVVSRRLTFSRNLAFSALVLLAGFVAIPLTVFGSTYADMRLAPYVFAVAVLAIRFRGDTHLPTGRALALLGLAFLLVRLTANTVSLAIASEHQSAKLQALEYIEMGSRVVTLVGQPCRRAWPLPRDSHLGAMVIVRRQGFSNDQWVMEGMNLLDLKYRDVGAFGSDPSQMVKPEECGRRAWTIGDALRALPRDRFDYLWTIDIPPYDPGLVEGMQLIWRGPETRLYRIRPDTGPPRPATPRTASEAAR